MTKATPQPSSTVVVKGHTAYTHRNDDEARNDFDRWVAEVLELATPTDSYAISFGWDNRRITVLGHDDGRLTVHETHNGKRREWTPDEVRNARRAARPDLRVGDARRVTSRSRRATQAIVTVERRTAYIYASVGEARHMFRRWVAEALRSATGDRSHTIDWGNRRIEVLGHDDGSLLVFETRHGERRVWGDDEVRDARRTAEPSPRPDGVVTARLDRLQRPPNPPASGLGR